MDTTAWIAITGGATVVLAVVTAVLAFATLRAVGQAKDDRELSALPALSCEVRVDSHVTENATAFSLKVRNMGNSLALNVEAGSVPPHASAGLLVGTVGVGEEKRTEPLSEESTGLPMDAKAMFSGHEGRHTLHVVTQYANIFEVRFTTISVFDLDHSPIILLVPGAPGQFEFWLYKIREDITPRLDV